MFDRRLMGKAAEWPVAICLLLLLLPEVCREAVHRWRLHLGGSFLRDSSSPTSAQEDMTGDDEEHLDADEEGSLFEDEMLLQQDEEDILRSSGRNVMNVEGGEDCVLEDEEQHDHGETASTTSRNSTAYSEADPEPASSSDSTNHRSGAKVRTENVNETTDDGVIKRFNNDRSSSSSSGVTQRCTGTKSRTVRPQTHSSSSSSSSSAGFRAVGRADKSGGPDPDLPLYTTASSEDAAASWSDYTASTVASANRRAMTSSGKNSKNNSTAADNYYTSSAGARQGGRTLNRMSADQREDLKQRRLRKKRAAKAGSDGNKIIRNTNNNTTKAVEIDLGPHFPDVISLVDPETGGQFSVDMTRPEPLAGGGLLPGAYASSSSNEGQETYDVHVKLYQDANCFEQTGSRTFAASTSDVRTTTFTQTDVKVAASGIVCYANTFPPNPTDAVAFDFAIVRFHNGVNPDDQNEKYKKTVNLRQYTDHCRTRAGAGFAPIQAFADESECADFLGPFYAVYSLLPRRAGGCSEGEACSTLKMARQLFYPTSTCAGNPTVTYKYPIQKECLRYSNGTQNFSSDAGYVNITERDYEGSSSVEGCQGPTRTYQMEMNKCYSLYGNRGFRWETDGNYLASSAQFGAAPALQTTFFLLLLGLWTSAMQRRGYKY
ncbi:unnamed protein product [Amoebophrya sp. A120]|nr:unnamed protein product [Amoebophrya sp. A120]|eukprot:GSA120T00017962001.1